GRSTSPATGPCRTRWRSAATSTPSSTSTTSACRSTAPGSTTCSPRAWRSWTPSTGPRRRSTPSSTASPAATTSSSSPPAPTPAARATPWPSTPGGSTGRRAAPGPPPAWPSSGRAASSACTPTSSTSRSSAAGSSAASSPRPPSRASPPSSPPSPGAPGSPAPPPTCSTRATRSPRASCSDRGATMTEQTTDDVARRAADAYPATSHAAPAVRADALRRAAATLGDHADDLVALAQEETGLAEARLRGELTRARVQLRLFAHVAQDGTYLDARLDEADPDFVLGPRPDLRRTLWPVGPVLVFAASNFPFAFSVAGGDTAAALAAGCPVVVKAHPGHPRLSERVAELVSGAL